MSERGQGSAAGEAYHHVVFLAIFFPLDVVDRLSQMADDITLLGDFFA